jgi:hypothetical protein
MPNGDILISLIVGGSIAFCYGSIIWQINRIDNQLSSILLKLEQRGNQMENPRDTNL